MKTLVAMVLNGLASLVAQTIKIYLKCRRPGLSLWVREMPWGRAWKPNSSILAGRILWSEELGGLQSMGLQRVRHDWATNTLSFSQSEECWGPHATPYPKPSDSVWPVSRWLPWSPRKSRNSPPSSPVLSSTLRPPESLQRSWLPPWPRQARGLASCLCRLICSRRCGLALCLSLIPCIVELGKSLLALLWLYNYLSSALNMKGVKWIITLGLKWVNETESGKPGHKVILSATEKGHSVGLMQCHTLLI